MKILLKPLDGFSSSFLPSRGSAGAAAWDLYCAEDTKLEAYKPTLVRTCFEIAVPEGYGLFVLPRSGNAIKKGFIIPNSPGLIDEDYRGEPKGIFTYIPHPSEASTFNRVTEGITGLLPKMESIPSFIELKRGDKMAQLMLIKYEHQEWEVVSELPATGRGKGGFGSTDTSPQTNNSAT